MLTGADLKIIVVFMQYNATLNGSSFLVLIILPVKAWLGYVNQ
jgi:hypothetical protein